MNWKHTYDTRKKTRLIKFEGYSCVRRSAIIFRRIPKNFKVRGKSFRNTVIFWFSIHPFFLQIKPSGS